MQIPAVPVLCPRSSTCASPAQHAGQQGGLLKAQVVDNNAATLVHRLLPGRHAARRVDPRRRELRRLRPHLPAGARHSLRAFSGRRGIANAFGAKGTNAQCEYVITGAASGTGVCLFSDGAHYQMHFGG